MRLALAALILAALAACDTTPPDDAALAARMQISDEAVATEPQSDEDIKKAEEDAAALAEEVRTALVTGNNPTISDTQDFSAVTERVSIEADKELLKAQREQFKVIEPTALPPRVDTENVVQYALTTTNMPGEKLYSRANPLGAAMSKRACKNYRLPDDAQAAFLKAGGPKRDPKSLDPDGDGFACDWSPVTYRSLAKK